jgi:hypothetical protein
MSPFLLDGRVLATRYLLGPGTDRLDHLFALLPQKRLFCLMWSVAEVVALLVRARHAGRLTPTLFAATMLQLRLEVTDNPHFDKLPADGPLIRASLALLQDYRLNASDGIALQAALWLATQRPPPDNNVVLVTSTRSLLKAARAEGLITFNPDKQSTADLDALIGP